MKRIPLTQGKYALVDDEDYERLMAMGKWFAIKHHSGSFYAGRRSSDKSSQTIKYMHRFILGLNDANVLVDHIDGNGLNNVRKNIRACTSGENTKNQKLRKNNSSGFKGVYWDKPAGKWRVQIKGKWNKRIHLGYFYCRIEAARAYNAAAIIHHCEFARLNEIPA